MTFWRYVLPNMLLHGQDAVLVVSTSSQNFYQWGMAKFHQHSRSQIFFSKHLNKVILYARIDFETLSGSENFSGLNDLNLWPLKIKNSMHFTYWVISLSGLNDLNFNNPSGLNDLFSLISRVIGILKKNSNTDGQ